MDGINDLLVVQMRTNPDSKASFQFLIIPLSESDLKDQQSGPRKKVIPRRSSVLLSPHIWIVLGMTSNSHQLIFIDHNSWISSVDMDVLNDFNEVDRYNHHFFVPGSLFGSDRSTKAWTNPQLTADEDIVFIKPDGPLTVRGGLGSYAVKTV
ncbi:putative GPI inositol-deacylase [Seiridium cardinale]|uniref:GPI inositol-deacylase n=1 Tax=Seiridium cardinale TaxID=138064 RepID=A0ABR2X677_9PEZI